jgi:FtsH-binding integral membrane protein
MLAPLGAVLFLSFRIEQMSAGAAQATSWTYAALMGCRSPAFFCSSPEPVLHAFSSSLPEPSPL